ncbi:putative cyclin-B3-1 [Cynara cardunculus var. scolymus]|uniref:putative cyclin-B3-1 n=1 Tax=Cynara cardunculus var. scolymus TaxID=59895 RepID=UPI000D6316B1|nr:putative cyclin-B3-1 [Cynara cardunculus var. scolymus]
MVVVKGLSTFKGRVSGGRDTRKSGGVRSLKVYAENEKVKSDSRGPVAAETKRKSIPVKAETSHVHANHHKVDVNKLEKINGKNINSGRKVLADISNSNIQKNETFDSSRPGASVGTRVRTASSSGKPSMGTHVGSQSEAVDGRNTLRRVGAKDLKVFNGNPRTRLQGQETVGDATRKSARIYNPPQRKSLPVLKHVDKADTCDLNKGSLENKVKSKEKCGFSVKPKVGTKVVPQVSNARDYRWKNRVSDGYIKMRCQSPCSHGCDDSRQFVVTRKTMSTSLHAAMQVSEGHQPTGDAHRLSRRSMKPTVKTTIGIPRAQRVSKSTSVSSKSTFAASVSSRRKEVASRSSFSKHTEAVTCEKPAEGVPSACNSNLDASTSNVAAKRKSGRRKSYTSLLIARSTLLKENDNVTKQEILPNIYDECNHLEVAEYIDEIYQHYWVTEAHNQPLKNYMEIQTEITAQMRGILINWLIEVHLKFDLMQETLYLMVTLLDCYLSVVTIKKNEMQLVGLTALLLASKYEDFWHPKVMELISISAEVYTRDQMLGMETTILKKLNFRLNLPTPYVFMLRFLRAAQAGKKFENLAFFLIELCLVEYDALHFKPSLLCASAIYVARCTLHLTPPWTPLLCKHSHYHEFQIRDCAEMILRFHQAARTAVLKVTYDKYMGADNCRVATIRPLDKLPTQ